MANPFTATEYPVYFNGYQLPGYPQSESFDNQTILVDNPAWYWDGTQTDISGNSNMQIKIEFLLFDTEGFRGIREQYLLAKTYLTSARDEYSELYIGYLDRFYLAKVKNISRQTNANEQRKVITYTVEFECLPYSIGLNLITIDNLGNVTEEPVSAPGTPGAEEPGSITVTRRRIGAARVYIRPPETKTGLVQAWIKPLHEARHGLARIRVKAIGVNKTGQARATILDPTPRQNKTGHARARIKATTRKYAQARVRIGTVSGSFADIPPHWDLVFADEFDRTVAEGHFMDGSTDSYHTADGRYLVFKNGWLDTSQHGTYSQQHIFIQDNMLQIRFLTENGRPRVAALTCLPTGSSAKGGILGMRTFLRIRADHMEHYKGVPLIWADAATTNNLLMTYGEIDWPESSFPLLPKAYMHRTNASSLSDQFVFPAPTGTRWTDWHNYEIEWIPNTSVEYFIDGVSIGKATSRIPNTPMHFNLQFETALGGEPAPAASTTGLIQIARVAVWKWIP